ncbi:MAG: RsiV family protein [bacterium]
MRKILFAFLVIYCSSGSGQELIPAKGYFHLTGKIDNTILVTMDLVKDRDTLYSSHSLRSTNYNTSTFNIWYSNPKDLCGKISSSGNFTLKEVFSESGQQIAGQMTGSGLIKGTWKVGSGKQKLPFELREGYPAGSVQFNVFSIKGSKSLTKKPNSQKGIISMVVLLPEESNNPVTSDSLRTFIIEKFTGKKDDQTPPEKLLGQVRESFFENYQTSNEPLLKEFPDAPTLNWEMLKFMHILNNADYHLTFFILTYAFTGGAHGLETEEFFNLDLKTGRLFTLKDIFKDGSDEILSGILTRKLHELIKIPETQKLTDAGYFTDTIKPTANFYLTENGIGFYYNQYDIAPYSFGPADVFLPFEEIKEILK